MNLKSILILTLGFPSIVLSNVDTESVALNQAVSSDLGGDLSGWVSLAIVAGAIMIAWFINGRSGKLRALGTLLAAAACLAVVAWYVSIASTGILDNPKPNQTPMDSAKPLLLLIQSGIALVAGLMLVFVAFKQIGKATTLELPAKNQLDRYGLVSRIIHWTTAMLFLSLILTGIFASMIPEGFWFRNQYYVIHKTLGVTVMIILLIRLFWNRHSKRPALDASLKNNERKWAHRAHLALYFLMVAIPITGFVMTSFHGFPTFFFFWEFGPFWGESKAYIVWGLFHKYVLQYLLYIVLGAHILGALKHHFIDKKEDAIKRMAS